MGYGMSRPDMDIDMHDTARGGDAARLRRGHGEAFDVDNEIFYLTRLRSEPSAGVRQAIDGRRTAPISTIRMLSGREANVSGRGRFSSADCSYVLGRYLPVNGPWPVDRMDSRVYVSQFSEDGSLFVAAFQVFAAIAESVYASMTPIVHIVNMETAATESHANITVCFMIHKCLYDFFGSTISFDVNTVAFADETGNVIYSGSDDNLCKVLSGSSPPYSPFLSIIILPFSNSVSNVEHLRDVSGDQVARLQCHQLTVRDCSWHPYYPLLVSSSWDGQITRWEFPGNDAVHATNNKIRGGSIEDQMFRVMYL
ncbi:hypothetical protein BHE74_00012928 [Ensete ventricosum]|nr:hypothetical protein GW17_00037539 [Ensete ventricosum]RWW78833.1 hypothetical protein BHE74_00012928 [Ensete ventricosum]RZR90668.1 hypothetical protein BHM03_00018606 [Ensete ventricosum]